jgi:hypothetical protein
MIGHLGLYRPDHANVVDAFADLGKNVADFDSALPVLLKSERGAHQVPGLGFGHERSAGHRLAIVLGQHRLGIERIHLGDSAVHEQEDHVFCLGGEVSRTNVERAAHDWLAGCSERAGDGTGQA